MVRRQEVLRVFLSSSMDATRADGPEFAEERKMLRTAFEKDLQFNNFCLYAIEDHAYPGRPREYYLNEVAKSWAIVVLIGVNYRKAVDDEVQKAFEHGVKPFVYLKPAEGRAEETEELINRLSQRVTWATYSEAQDFVERVALDLNEELVRAQTESEPLKQELDDIKKQMAGEGEKPSEQKVEEAVRRYAGAALEQGELDAAIANLQWLATVGRDPADAHYLMAEIYERVGFWQQASHHYQQVLSRIPHNLDALRGQCRVCNRLQRYGQADLVADAALGLLHATTHSAVVVEILVGKYEALLGLSRDLNRQEVQQVRGQLLTLARESGDDEVSRYVLGHVSRITSMLDHPRVELGFVISGSLEGITTVPGDAYAYPIRIRAVFLRAETSDQAVLRFMFMRPIILSATRTAISFPETGLVGQEHRPRAGHYFVECELDISRHRTFEFGFEIDAARIAPGEYQVQAHVTMGDGREMLWVLLLRVSDSWQRLTGSTTFPPDEDVEDS